MFCFLSTGESAVLYEQLRANVVLVQTHALRFVSLRLYEIQRPQHFWHVHVRHQQLGLGQASRVQLQLSRITCGRTSSHGEHSSAMSPTVPMSVVRRVHEPFQ